MNTKSPCENVIELLSDFVDGRLDAQQKASIEAHVGHCANCARQLGQERALVLALGEIRNEPMVAPNLERVSEKGRRRVYAWAGALATAAVSFALVTPNLRNPGSTRPTPEANVGTPVAEENREIDETYLVIVASEQGADPNRALVLASRSQRGKLR